MNTTYLLIMSAFALYAIIQVWVVPNFTNSDFLRGWSTVISLLVFFAMLLASFGPTLADPIIETRECREILQSDRIIAIAEGFPTLSTTEMGHMNKELYIQKIIRRNAWGIKFESSVSYKITTENK
jgi:hypothetical protein